MKRMKLGYFLLALVIMWQVVDIMRLIKKRWYELRKIIEQAKILEQMKFDFLFFQMLYI